MNKKWLTLLIWILSIVALDQLTKYWIVSTIPVGGGWALIPHFADIVHYRNPGAAFGMLAGWDSNYRNYFFFAVSLVAIVILIYYISKSPQENKRTTIPLML